MQYIQQAQAEVSLGIRMDEVKGTFWVFTNKSLYELIITDEDRDVWKLQLLKNNFEQALRYVKTDLQKEEVLQKKAEYHFGKGEYELSAITFAQSKRLSFEDIALKFIHLADQKPLKRFLRKKLECLKKTVSLLHVMSLRSIGLDLLL